jgi:glutamate racemase
MHVDLLAGTVYAPSMGSRASKILAPKVLVFDSGVGGLTVFSELAKARADARFVYAADDAAFPYGRLAEDEIVARVVAVMDRLIERHAPDLVVIACHTASTLVLPALRQRFPIPFVGTVPAVKPAAALSRSRRIAVLATSATVARDYTRDLVETYAGGCAVALVGSRRLAALAEAELTGAPGSDDDIRAEIAPCFTQGEGGPTDVVVLACTHYPLLLPRLERLAPWPVTWIDPAPAIARRVVQLLGAAPAAASGEGEALAVFTGGATVTHPLRSALSARGLARVAIEAMPLAQA